MRASTLLLATLFACADAVPNKDDTHADDTDNAPIVDTERPDPVVDADDDGYGSDVDCDDGNPAVNPGATEVCNGIDDDCTAGVDVAREPFDGAVGPYFADNDADGFGRDDFARWACEAPGDGWSDVGGDCDDMSAAISPAADEVCNEVDDDCDNAIDDADDDVNPIGAPDAVQRWVDADGDGYGTGSARWFCVEPATGVASQGGDCDDSTPARNPDVQEQCTGVDDDCDGRTDAEDDTVDPSQVSPHYADTDGDGFGDPAMFRPECTGAPRAGWVANDEDCRDNEAWNFPGNAEICDNRDNDCDNDVDEEDDSLDPALLTDYWRDADNDGYGDPATQVATCDPPAGWVDNDDDCEDQATVSGVDPEDRYPGRDETCNGVDDDCDGDVDDQDDDVLATDVYYPDVDADTYGDPSGAQAWCAPPVGWVERADDCDDGDDHANPDRGTSESIAGCYRDGDEDGYGDASATGSVTAGTDCDDSDDDTFPGAGELETTPACHADRDEDGYGDASATGLVQAGTDCDDGDAAIRPDAAETWYDGTDQDCSGGSDYDQDGDGDDRETDGGTDCDDGDPTRAGTLAEIPYDTIDQDCSGADLCDVDGDGFDAEACPSGTDCDDDAASVNPDGVEVCNDVDDDCANGVDDGLETFVWYRDFDEDGWGNEAYLFGTLDACGPPDNQWSRTVGDCDDSDDTVNPDATESCNGNDDNCDGVADEGFPTSGWYPDDDGDGWGVQAYALQTCLPLPSNGYAGQAGDCDDADGNANPGGSEACNGIDDDCDGVIDNGHPLQAWYADADGDGQGDPTLSVMACAAPPGTSASASDCDDTDDDVFTGAPERCNGIDDDCNGGIDDDGVLVLQDFDADRDGDGFGNPNDVVQACAAGPGMVASGGDDDCDDQDERIHPGADDPACDGIDQGCDGDLPEYVIPSEADGANHVQILADLAGQTEVAICYEPGTYGSAADPASIPAIVETVGLGATADDVLIYQPPGTSYTLDRATFRNVRLAGHGTAPLFEDDVTLDGVHITWNPATTATPDVCDGLISPGRPHVRGGTIIEGLHATCSDLPRLFGEPGTFEDATLRHIDLTSTSTSRYAGLLGGSLDDSPLHARRVRFEDIALTLAGEVEGGIYRSEGDGDLVDVDFLGVHVTSSRDVDGGLAVFDMVDEPTIGRLRFRDVTVRAPDDRVRGGLIHPTVDSASTLWGSIYTRTLANVDVAGVVVEADEVVGGLLFIDTPGFDNEHHLDLVHATIAGVVVHAPTLDGAFTATEGRDEITVERTIVAWARHPTSDHAWGLDTTLGDDLAGFNHPNRRYGHPAEPSFNDVRLTTMPSDISFDDPASWNLQLSASSPYLDALPDVADADGTAGDLGAYGGADAGPIDGPWFDWPRP